VEQVSFSFSDSIAGYVKSFDRSTDCFVLTTTDGRDFTVAFTDTTYAEMIRNLGEPYQDCTGQMRDMLVPGLYMYAYGIYYPEKSLVFDAKHLIFVGRTPAEYKFERSDWWIKQIESLGDWWLEAQFGKEKAVDYKHYRTMITREGVKIKNDDFRQETDTISRLVYGFASAYLLTGDDRYLEGAEKGTEYLREHMRFFDLDERIVYWYHAIDVKGNRETKIFASEFGDDYDAIPAYEQIYALTGPMQTYRITGDPAIKQDAELTVKLFDDYFYDKGGHGGFFSHIDPITLDARSDTLGHNQGRKNWNSVGDHAPAYLINYWLATGDPKLADFLEYTFDTIVKHFPDYENSPFVQERFHEDWSHDKSWGWQKNRAVVGHNLKIAWNLMRMYSLKPKAEYKELAEKIADLMPSIGSDLQHGGWYDVMERTTTKAQTKHRFVWHNRKAWWQQEQAILAYYILAGVLGKKAYLRHGREAASYYNAFFLDHFDGGIYFNVLSEGIPYLEGTERYKGSHSMSGYHSFELAYLCAVYSNLLVRKNPMVFYFKPMPDGFDVLRVSPDILPPGSIKIDKVMIDDKNYSDFDADGLTINLPKDRAESVRVKVRIVPVD
jgi:mannose/cellobiose epimerase-like protein (N-acyl-D-glucosamine 2-epimerase family)